MRSHKSKGFFVTAMVGLVLLMLPVSMVGSSSSTDDYATAVFGVS